MAEWRGLPGETPIDISYLKIAGIQTRSQLNEAEALNVRKVVLKYFGRPRPTRRMAPFTLKWLKRLHQEMFGDVWEWAGCNRRAELNIGVKWHLIDEKLQQLLDDRICWEENGIEALEQAVMLHHRAAQIHPFYNGNGRWARMLANIFLRARGHRETEWPEARLGTASAIRDDYLAAIRAADDGDYALLLSLHRKYTQTLPGRIMVVKRPSTSLNPGRVIQPPLIQPPEEE